MVSYWYKGRHEGSGSCLPLITCPTQLLHTQHLQMLKFNPLTSGNQLDIFYVSYLVYHHIINLRCMSMCKILTKFLRIKMLIWVISMKVKDKKSLCLFSVCVSVCLCVFLCVLTNVIFLNYGKTVRLRDPILCIHNHMIPRSYAGEK